MRLTRSSTRLEGWLLAAPFVLCLCLFYLYPGLRGLALAFSDGWIGEFKPSLAAWGRVFVPNFWKSLKASLIFSALSLPVTAIAVAVVVVMQPLPKTFCTGVQFALYLPAVASGVAMSIIWKWLFHPTRGLLNLLLGHEILWLADPAIAPLSVSVVQALPSIGPGVFIISALAVQIPKELYEQAHLDGCGSWRAALRITIPLLLPVLLFLIASGMVVGFRLFTPVMLLTKGGPGHATSSMTWLIYETAFIGSDHPRAAATALMQNILLLPLLWVLYKGLWHEA